MNEVYGIEEADRFFRRLASDGVPAAANKAIHAAGRALNKALRAAVKQSGASTAARRAALRSIGVSRVPSKDHPRIKVVKIGFGVGKRSAAWKRQVERRKTKRNAKSRPGVGIEKQNIHWLVLGTAERRTSKRYTGRMPALFSGTMEMALAASKAACVDAALRTYEREIERLKAR